MLDAKIKEYLLTIQPFKYLELHELDMLISYSKIVSFTTNQHILKQGKPTEGMYIILKGKALVSARVLGKGAINLATINQGNFVGEISAIEKVICTASVVALENVNCLLVTCTYFDMLTTFFPKVRYKIMRGITAAVCGRLQDAHKAIDQIMKKSDISPGLSFVQYIHSLAFPHRTSLKKIGLTHEVLKNSDFFRSFSAAEYDVFMQHAKVLKASKQCVLIHEGDKNSAYYIVLYGALQINITQGKKIAKLGVFGPVSLLGATDYIDHQPALFSFITCEKSVVLKIDNKSLDKIKNENVLLWYKIYDAICHSIIALENFSYKFYLRLNGEHYNE